MIKFEQVTIYIHDLKPETCVDIINNLHGEERLGHRISVFSWVEDTPTKASGEDLEKMIENDVENDSATERADIMKEVDDASKEPPAPLTPIDQNPATTSPSMIHNLVSGMTSRFWTSIAEADYEDTYSDEDLDNLREQFKKRKAEGSPTNNEFETVLTKKEKKKIKNL